MRTVWRVVGAALLWGGVAATLAWPILRAESRTCYGDAAPRARAIRLTLDRSTKVRLPANWYYTQSQAGEHFVLGIAASNDACAVSDLIEQTPTALSVSSIATNRLAPEDVFISVSGSYSPVLPEEPLPRAPRVISLSDLAPGGAIWGQPVFSLSVGSIDDYATYGVRVWIGPNSSTETRQDLLDLLADVKLL